MPAEESGLWLLERMQSRLGLTDYAGTSLLDFGCGVRFSQTIVNRHVPFGEYCGVDCFAEMIEFLEANVADPRCSYLYLDAHHRLYNPAGTPLGPETRLALPEGHFDVISMFSVLTHQYPDDAKWILRMLRRYVRADGRLFVTCFLDECIEAFEDRSPERNGGFCFYNPTYLESLIAESGWQTVASYPGEGPLIGFSYVCRPVAVAEA
jgi:SAM-dependent methyltransferase